MVCTDRKNRLELYFKDSRSLLVVFLDKQKRQAITDRLSSIISGDKYSGDTLTPGFLKSPLPIMERLSARVSATMNAKVLMGFKMDEIATAQRRWQAREISNVGRCKRIDAFCCSLVLVYLH